MLVDAGRRVPPGREVEEDHCDARDLVLAVACRPTQRVDNAQAAMVIAVSYWLVLLLLTSQSQINDARGFFFLTCEVHERKNLISETSLTAFSEMRAVSFFAHLHLGDDELPRLWKQNLNFNHTVALS